MGGIAERMGGMVGAGSKGRGGISSHMGGDGGGEHEREHDGEEHGQVHQFLKSQHSQHGGKHMHVHQHEDGGGYTTHHVGEDGKVEGPHDHQNTEELKEHLGRFFDEEEHEGSGHESHESHSDGLL